MILDGPELIGEPGGARAVVVSGGTIARVDDATDDLAPSVERLILKNTIAFPGLINSHDHLDFSLYPALGHKRYADYIEWGEDIQRRDRELIVHLERVPRSYRIRWGALKNLLCGVTEVGHHGNTEDALPGGTIGTLPGTSIHSLRWARRWRWRLNSPVPRCPYVFHVGEGTSPRARGEIDDLLRWNLFRRPLLAVHGVGMTQRQATGMRALVWCPMSNEFLYGATADVGTLKHTTSILFGTDSPLTGDWNFWTHLRHARALGALDDRELFDAVTAAAARVWGLPRSGRIAPGEVADLVVARKKTDDPWEAFFAVEPEDILLVVRAGSIVCFDASVGYEAGARHFSTIRLGATEKRVAEDVPFLLGSLCSLGVTPTLPIAQSPCQKRGQATGSTAG